jgi:hypothetical protein
MAMLAGGQRVAQYVGKQLGLALDGPGLAAFRFEVCAIETSLSITDYKNVADSVA